MHSLECCHYFFCIFTHFNLLIVSRLACKYHREIYFRTVPLQLPQTEYMYLYVEIYAGTFFRCCKGASFYAFTNIRGSAPDYCKTLIIRVARPSPMIYSRDFIFAICHIFFYYPYIRNYWRGLYFSVSMISRSYTKIKSSRTKSALQYSLLSLCPLCPSVGPSVSMSVFLNLVQLITQERFAPEASNLVGR